MSEQEKRELAAQQEPAGSDKKDSSDKKAKDAKKKKDAKKPNRVLKWFKDLRGELKKVTWPSVRSVLKNVGVVIACVLIVGVCIWVFDWLARLVVDALLELAKSFG